MKTPLSKLVIVYWIALVTLIALATLSLSLIEAGFPRWICIGLLVTVVSLLVFDVVQKEVPYARLFPIFGRLYHAIAMNTRALPFDRFDRRLIRAYAKDSALTISFGEKIDPIEGKFRPSLFPCEEAEITRHLIGSQERAYLSNRLNFSALGHGPVSGKMVDALGRAALTVSCFQNTGEDGLSDLHTAHGQEIVLQLGTGYLGFSSPDGTPNISKIASACSQHNIVMIELKLSQGAKPGAGGYLDGAKVTSELAKKWGVPVGEAVVTRSRHPGIKDARSLLQLVEKLQVSCRVPVGIKICFGSEAEIANLISHVHELGINPDFITVDGASGGSGAADAELMRYAGVPLFDALPIIDQKLRAAGLRKDISLLASGRINNGFTFLRAIALGADVCSMARGPMIAAGCVQAQRCHTGNCPSGIATNDFILTASLDSTAATARIAALHRNIIGSAERLLKATGKADPTHLTPEDLF